MKFLTRSQSKRANREDQRCVTALVTAIVAMPALSYESYAQSVRDRTLSLDRNQHPIQLQELLTNEIIIFVD